MQHALTRYRAAAKVSQSRMAEMVGTTRQTIYRIEHGKQNPSLDLIRRLVTATGGMVRADDFISVREHGEAHQ